MSMKPFTVISETEEYRDRDRFSVIRMKLETPNGKEVDWTCIKQNDGVIVVALDNSDEVYIKREWRLNRRDFVWELPGGYIDIDSPTEQDILDAGNRELQEEIGVKGGALVLLKSFYISNHSTSK
jgi:hypothetical protein